MTDDELDEIEKRWQMGDEFGSDRPDMLAEVRRLRRDNARLREAVDKSWPIIERVLNAGAQFDQSTGGMIYLCSPETQEAVAAIAALKGGDDDRP